MLQIITISKNDFFEIKATEVKRNVDSNVIYLIKNVIDRDVIKFIREEIEEWTLNEEQRWVPLDENCVNFHRINDDYEKSYVKTKAHTFYYNLWLKESEPIKNYFLEIFDFKRQITNFANLDYLHNKPIDGFVSRVIVHHYPIGGGYMEEHTDPVNIYNPVQTIIQASEKGKDYISGGLFVRDPESNEEIFVDDDFRIGDMIVFNPHIPHGVKPIDKNKETDWKVKNGRYLIIPLSLRSDLIKNNEESPKGISYDNRN